MAGSRRSLTIGLVAVGVAVVAATGVLFLGTHHHASSAAGTSGVALGEAIYQSGVGPGGRPIQRTVSGGGGMMGGGAGMIAGGGCATCHGSDGRGRTTIMFTAPNVAYANLTDPQGMLMPDGTRGPTYTDATIRRAVTTGIDPEGSHLDWPMPQWQLTNEEWTSLLAYLKTLQ